MKLSIIYSLIFGLGGFIVILVLIMFRFFLVMEKKENAKKIRPEDAQKVRDELENDPLN